MLPFPTYTMLPQGVFMPQQFSSFQPTQAPSTAEASNDEQPSMVYPQQIPVVYSQVPGFGGYGDGVSAVPVMFPSYGMNMPMASMPMQESPYFYGQSSSKERTMPPESGGIWRRLRVDRQNANLFVFNIPPRYNDEDLRKLFEPFGRIVSCKVRLGGEIECR